MPAVAAAVDADGTSAEQAKQRRVAKARASAIVDAALEAGEMDGDAILGMIDVRVVDDADVDDDERTPAAKGSTGSTEDGALGAEESLRVSRAVPLFQRAFIFKHQIDRTCCCSFGPCLVCFGGLAWQQTWRPIRYWILLVCFRIA